MKAVTQSGRWGERLRTAIVAFALLVAGAIVASVPSPAFAAPAAGTVIGNQASATYTDAGGTPRTATSNLVQTTVSQIKSYTLTADGARTASAGQTVYYPHTITNTGNGTDTYTLNAPTTSGTVTHTGLAYYIDGNGDGVPDNFTPIVTSGPIAAAGIFRFVVAGTVPGSAANGTTGSIIVSVSDTDAPVDTQTNTDVTTVANAAVNVTKSLSVTSGPSPNAGPITVTLSYTNTGSAAATNLELRDPLPAGMTYIAGSGRWSVTGASALTDDTVTAEPNAGITYDFGQTVAGRVTAVIGSVPAGFSGTLTFQVSIAAGVTPGFINNTAAYLTGGTSPQPVTNTNTASYQVVQTAAVVANNSTTASTNGGAFDTVTVPAAAAGSTINFTNVIWNMGNAADSFVISLGGSTFPAGSTLTLLQSDGVTSLIANTTPSIPVGTCTGFETDGAGRCGYRVILRVQLPVTAAGGPYSVAKTATSVFDNTKTDVVTDTLTAVTPNTVDLTNNSAGGAAPGAGATGTTVITTNTVTPSTTGATVTRFRLYVNNTGSINDSFNLSVAGTPAGWSVVFRADGGVGDCSTVGASLTTTGTVNAGANRLVCAEVTVPVTTSGQAAAGNYDLDFTAASALNPGLVNDVKRDRVTVNAVHAVSLTPNNTQQTFPGGSVTYTHVLANLGNASETITFPGAFLANSRSAQGWTSVAYLDNGNGTFDPGVDDLPANLVSNATSFALAVNTSRTIFVRVFAPGSAVAADPANVTTITATYNAGAATASATDSTSVTDGLTLLKEQAAAPCGAAYAGAYSTAPIPSGAATAPGQCIAYRITATNTTATNVSLVVVNDNIPANTTQHNSCGAPACTGCAGAVSSPGNGLTGTISANVGPLTPSQSAVVTFCVRIDP